MQALSRHIGDFEFGKFAKKKVYLHAVIFFVFEVFYFMTPPPLWGVGGGGGGGGKILTGTAVKER